MEERHLDDPFSPDFSHLPDVAWVKVFQYLPMKERFLLSETCHALYEAFNHPSLWSNQKILLFGASQNYTRRTQNVILVDNYVNITQRFGKYFQNLTIQVKGHFRAMSSTMREILTEVGKQCRLESLTIDAGALTSQFHEEYGYAPNDSAVKALTSFVQHAFRMRHLHIRSWPMFKDMDTPECNIFVALLLNDTLKVNLESLTIFGLDQTTWSEREPILLNVPTTLHLISCFKRLTRIGLRSPMISQELLEMLSEPERAKLELLEITVHYIPANREFKIPTIDSQVWQALVNRNPDFRVECTMMFDTPAMELSNMLTPEVPLSVLTYMKYSRISPHTLPKVHSHYKSTLTQFRCFCDAKNIDEDMLQIAKKCENLTEFIYHGEILSTTVVAIANAKGPAWKCFEINEKNIKIHNEFDDLDEDQVIARRPDGQYVMVGLMKFHQPEEDRVQQLNTMVAEVTHALGRPWKPIN